MLNNQASKEKRASLHGNWSSKMAFILAVTGSAVGLGNIWKFPYVAGQNGGGAFVLVYLFCVIIIGMPVMMSEILIGRRGRRNPVAAMDLLSKEEKSSSKWRWVGIMGVLGGVLILSYYSVIAGWTLGYALKSITGVFVNASPQVVSSEFSNFVGNWKVIGFYHTLFMALTIFFVARGVEKGLERAVKIMVPVLLILMLVLLGYAIKSGFFGQGLHFMFSVPDSCIALSQECPLTWNSVLVALGQAFFTLSIGMGAVMAYGAYLPEETSIIGASAAVVTADTGIAILAGLAIFPLVFANGLDPADGPGLVFQTLPLAFGQMSDGVFFSTIFFILLSFAAWTSAIALIEPAVAWVIEQFDKTRTQASLIIGILIWILGFGSVLSFNLLKNMIFLAGTFFDNVDYLTSNIILPFVGLLITIFAGWIMSSESSIDELDNSGFIYKSWRLLARYIAPIGIILVLINAII